MTIGVAWVRTTKNGAQELIVVSDSRLSGHWDASPKIVPLPRNDAVLAFAGNTFFSYPIMIQLQHYIYSHGPLLDGSFDYSKMRTYLLNVIRDLLKHYSAEYEALETPDVTFLLGGYSWFKKEFCIDELHYDPTIEEFTNHRIVSSYGGLGLCHFIGDWAQAGKEELLRILRNKFGVSVLSDNKNEIRFNWEPFEAVRNLLRQASTNDTIGGAPQILKVSQHMTTSFMGVYWPNKVSGEIWVSGRPAHPSENLDTWILQGKRGQYP